MAQTLPPATTATNTAPHHGLTLAMSIGGEEGLNDLSRLREYGVGIEITDFIGVATWQGDYQAHARRWAAALRGFPGDKCLHGAFTDLAPGALEPDVIAFARRRHQQSLEVAATLGCDLMVVHSDFPPREAQPTQHAERAARLADYFGTLAEKAAPLGIAIVIENIRDGNPRQLADLAAAIARPNLGLSLDVGHANLYGPAYALDEWALTLAPALRHVHLHDNDGWFDRHWAVGAGTMNFRAFLATVAALAPAPRVTIEAAPRADAWQTLEGLIADGWYAPAGLGGTH